jgi:hypothetical protein
MDLAKVIYNLQPVRGFDECITRMRNGDIEGTCAELDFGRMLFLNQVPFRFVVPRARPVPTTMSKSSTHRASSRLPTPNARSREPSSASTIRNTLNKARKQLPDDWPGIVFFKVPLAWISDGGRVATMLNAARGFLRGTRRVVSVKFYSSPITLANGILRHDHAYKEISKPLTDSGDNQDWNIFRKFDLPPEWNGMPPHWQRIIFLPDGMPR